MSQNKVVALIGLPPLIAGALRCAAQQIGGIETVVVSDADNLQRATETYDAFIADVLKFAVQTRFFLPRKERVAIYCPFPSRSATDYPIPLLFEDSTEEEALQLLEKLCRNSEEAPAFSGELSARETDVLRLIASGLTNKEIADRLNISVNTAITHRKNLTSKLGIRSASGLSLYALMHGLI